MSDIGKQDLFAWTVLCAVLLAGCPELEHRDVAFFYIARDAVGEAIGFCSCWRVLDEVHINNLAVVPEHRRAGK